MVFGSSGGGGRGGSEEKEDDIRDGRWWVGGNAPEVTTPEERSRTIVLVGRPERSPALDRKKILEVLGPSPCYLYKDVEVFRGTQETPFWFPMSKKHPFGNVLKVRFKTTALAELGRSRFTHSALKKLRASYIRNDLSLEELMYDARLRKKCQELNSGLKPKKWLVKDQRIVEAGTLRPYVENTSAKGPSNYFTGSGSSAPSSTSTDSVSAPQSFGNAIGNIENTKEKFAVSVDVRGFKPEELEVDVQGRELTIKGDHEERQESGLRISRSFVHKYILPEDVHLAALRPSVTKEGKLTIEAPKRVIKGAQTRSIPIQYV